jgi:hypothetical protein
MCGAWVEGTEAAGPWRGQILDAANGEPLEGVVVLALWDKISPGFMHPRRDFHDVDELVTGADGRFAIPERHLLTANPFVSLDAPNLVMFKPGYGRWRERGLPRELDRYDVWRLMEKESVLFEIPRLTNRLERLNALPSRPSDVAASRIPRFLEALNNERLFLGLSPLRRNEH